MEKQADVVSFLNLDNASLKLRRYQGLIVPSNVDYLDDCAQFDANVEIDQSKREALRCQALAQLGREPPGRSTVYILMRICLLCLLITSLAVC
jgi:hypothetical protein